MAGGRSALPASITKAKAMRSARASSRPLAGRAGEGNAARCRRACFKLGAAPACSETEAIAPLGAGGHAGGLAGPLTSDGAGARIAGSGGGVTEGCNWDRIAVVSTCRFCRRVSFGASTAAFGFGISFPPRAGAATMPVPPRASGTRRDDHQHLRREFCRKSARRTKCGG